jgi:hypothetical protein
VTAPAHHDTTIEEIEEALAAPKPKIADMKLEGDDIPADLRGKSVDELMKHAEALSRSLKLSEQARLTTTAPAPVAAPAPVVEEPKELTDAELAELHAEDPVKAIRYMQEQAVRVAQRNMEARVGPLVTGTSSAVENGARAKYPEEFAALGAEISAIIQTLPNKAVLSDPVAWDQIVAHARGVHFDKFFEHKNAKRSVAALATARAAEIETAGVSFAPTESASRGGTPVVTDEWTKEIAKNLNMTLEEYIKWSKV